ncbi:MAG: class I SAM-dependent methyltransferase [Candidatus Omnitrophica bacterium]|nr:class I SAM-dependent methyltransferase [Candidatus Omnitrophota bacterium]
MNLKTNTRRNFSYIQELEDYFNLSPGSYAEKMAAFAKFVPRQRLTDFLSLYEIFKKVLSVQGSVIDCGVYRARTLMTYAQLSAILEPMNYQRQIIGFDTFKGFLKIDKEDSKSTHQERKVGGYKAECYDDLLRCIELFDKNRFLSHIPKVILVKGDIEKTAPKYLKDNPHTIVSLLSLDLSLYAPTKAALRIFVPRMPKGGIITFGEMNCSDFSGEVIAVMEELGINKLRVQRNPFDTVASYAVLE